MILEVFSNLIFPVILNLLSTALFCSPQPCTRLCKSNININLWSARQSDASRVWFSDNHQEHRGVCGPQPQQYVTPCEISGRHRICQTLLCSLKSYIPPHTKIFSGIMNHSDARGISPLVPGVKILFSPIWEKMTRRKTNICVFLYVFSYSL